MKPYHPENLKFQPFAAWRVAILAYVGKVLGVQFKIDGIPYGAAYNKDLWDRHYATGRTSDWGSLS